ncbi:TPA: hypothetical protein DEP21_05785 [Patescibacteria group bacterium]|nr:hypothetical protein [Candidatus Gracilibacteria bacterium]
MEDKKEDKRIKCIHCNEYPGFISESLDGDLVFNALECECPKRTTFMRSKTFVAAEWESSTYKLTKEEAKKVEGLRPSDKGFQT